MAEASFGGSVPENYDRLLVPLIFEDYANDLVSRVSVPAGGRVLETACGTGVVTQKLRANLPQDTQIVATDLSPEMQAVAIAKLNQHDTLAFEIQDGTALTYDDNTFDAVVCQFGIMFYPDKAAGYEETARVLKPGGKFIFNVWDSLENNPLIQLGNIATATVVPDDPPAFLEIPFGYSDINEIRTQLQAAGFGRVNISIIPARCRAESARAAATTFATATPLAPIFAELGVGQAIDGLTAILADHYGDGPIDERMQAIAFEATLDS